MLAETINKHRKSDISLTLTGWKFFKFQSDVREILWKVTFFIHWHKLKEDSAIAGLNPFVNLSQLPFYQTSQRSFVCTCVCSVMREVWSQRTSFASFIRLKAGLHSIINTGPWKLNLCTHLSNVTLRLGIPSLFHTVTDFRFFSALTHFHTAKVKTQAFMDYFTLVCWTYFLKKLVQILAVFFLINFKTESNVISSRWRFTHSSHMC